MTAVDLRVGDRVRCIADTFARVRFGAQLGTVIHRSPVCSVDVRLDDGTEHLFLDGREGSSPEVELHRRPLTESRS